MDKKKMILYHGSKKDLDILKPFVSDNRRSAVYASTDFNFALCYSGYQWNDSLIRQSYYNKQLTLIELRQDIFKELFNTSGYVYTIDSDKFIKVPNGVYTEYYSFDEVYIKDKLYIENVLDKIRDSNIDLYYYPDKPNWFYNISRKLEN